jgi:hypothetical protein
LAAGLQEEGGDLVTRPDPSRLTTAQLFREIALVSDRFDSRTAALRELLETRLAGIDRATELSALAGVASRADMDQTRNRLREEIVLAVASLRELLEARFDGMDVAIRLHAEIIDKLPTDRDQAIAHLAGLHDEKFSSIAKQFTERDIRTDQATEAAKQALDAALLAQKELVAQQNEANAVAAAKAEASFTKQIDQIGTIIQTLEKALDARITELKERIDRGEGSTVGATGQRTETRLNNGAVLAVVGAVLAVVTIVVTIVLATGH